MSFRENQLNAFLERLFPEATHALQQMLREPSHHAWCIAGSTHGGQYALALYASRFLLSNPTDLCIINNGEQLGSMGVDQAQYIHAHLHHTPTGARNVVLIHDAERLTSTAVNALLKLMEEPPADSALLLDTATWGQLPATVRSRLHVLHVPAPTREQLWTAVETVAGHVVSLHTLIECTHGRVQDIIMCLTDPTAMERFQQHHAQSRRFLSATISEREQILTTVEDLDIFVQQCLHEVREQWLSTHNRSDRLTTLQNLQRMLSHHVNKKLICDYLIVRL